MFPVGLSHPGKSREGPGRDRTERKIVFATLFTVQGVPYNNKTVLFARHCSQRFFYTSPEVSKLKGYETKLNIYNVILLI